MVVVMPYVSSLLSIGAPCPGHSRGLRALDTCRRMRCLDITHAANVRSFRRHRVFLSVIHQPFWKSARSLQYTSPCLGALKQLTRASLFCLPGRPSPEHQQHEMGGGGLEGGARAEPMSCVNGSPCLSISGADGFACTVVGYTTC
ncbi:hypothetical protein L226DRAFT_329520 [Lentinus tigrinus ALCF2SS1-7]|uniref:Uncharacterized protein n=1 Tax=Lentinus tigrinus ALCF2SS1-6 TaxID=1328759 RepID=A0A5C2SFN2_9APHY|nr:hypothetical protein L227DRAFT_429124 [Lentinus tigrinus ALCF2SS1-6]RPD77690.1 hypothetical protein L226DRAFT_329520 [Lentinus tigrinus ALCF2SS1-7]